MALLNAVLGGSLVAALLVVRSYTALVRRLVQDTQGAQDTQGQIPVRPPGFAGALAAGAAVTLALAGFAQSAAPSGRDGVPAASIQNSGSGGMSGEGEATANLLAYAETLPEGGERAARASPAMLPGVETMISRLAARLEKTPDDANGWRTLGWSYFETGRFAEAAAAYGRAVALRPEWTEVRQVRDEARERAGTAEAEPAEAPGETEHGSAASAPETAVPQSAIRAMAEELARRLETAPRDADGWVRLMRSRTVLGEHGAARAARDKAMALFRGEAAALAAISAAAQELGMSGKASP